MWRWRLEPLHQYFPLWRHLLWHVYIWKMLSPPEMWVVTSVFLPAFTFCIDMCNPLGIYNLIYVIGWIYVIFAYRYWKHYLLKVTSFSQWFVLLLLSYVCILYDNVVYTSVYFRILELICLLLCWCTALIILVWWYIYLGYSWYTDIQ